MQSFTELVHKPVLVDLTIEEGQRLKVIYGSHLGFHAIDLDTSQVFDLYIPSHVSIWQYIQFYSAVSVSCRYFGLSILCHVWFRLCVLNYIPTSILSIFHIPTSLPVLAFLIWYAYKWLHFTSNGVLWMQKLRSLLLRIQSSKVLPLKTSSFRNSSFPVHSPSFFSQGSPRDFLALWLIQVSLLAHQSNIGHPPHCHW